MTPLWSKIHGHGTATEAYLATHGITCLVTLGRDSLDLLRVGRIHLYGAC